MTLEHGMYFENFRTAPSHTVSSQVDAIYGCSIRIFVKQSILILIHIRIDGVTITHNGQ